METNKNLKLGVILSYTNIVMSFLVAMIYMPILLKYLGQQQYGLYNMGQAAVSYLGLAEFGFGNAVVRYSAKYRALGDKKKEASLYGVFMYLYWGLATLIFVIGIIICIWIDRFYTVSTGDEGYRQLRIIILVMVVNLSFTFATAPYSSIITAYERYTFSKCVNLLYTILKPAAIVPLVIWGYKSIAISIVTFVLTASMHIANIIYVKKKMHISILYNKKELDFSILKGIASYSFFIFLGSIVSQLNDNADVIILGAISGEVLVAVYSLGRQVSSYVMQIPTTVSSVFFPRVTIRISTGASMQDMTDFMIRVGRIAFYLAMLVISGFILFGNSFILLWTGKDYLNAYWIVLVLAIPSIPPLIQSVGVQIVQAMNKHQFRAILYVVCAVLNVCFSVPAGMKYGEIGCASVTGLTSFITSGIIMNWFYYKKVGIDIPRFWKEIWIVFIKISPIIICGVVLSKIFRADTWTLLLVEIFIYSTLYFIVLYIYVLKDSEKNIVLSFLKRGR